MDLLAPCAAYLANHWTGFAIGLILCIAAILIVRGYNNQPRRHKILLVGTNHNGDVQKHPDRTRDREFDDAFRRVSRALALEKDEDAKAISAAIYVVERIFPPMEKQKQISFVAEIVVKTERARDAGFAQVCKFQVEQKKQNIECVVENLVRIYKSHPLLDLIDKKAPSSMQERVRTWSIRESDDSNYSESETRPGEIKKHEESYKDSAIIGNSKMQRSSTSPSELQPATNDVLRRTSPADPNLNPSQSEKNVPTHGSG